MLNGRLSKFSLKKRIGLLGGSFNPPHQGHIHISKLAIKYLKLDLVWWLISPQNPLKSVSGMAPFCERIRKARRISNPLPIVVTDIERNFCTNYTVDTIKIVQNDFKGVRFVWLMGADNLIQINQWKHWEEIFRSIPIAVLDRPPYANKAEASIASRQFSRNRIAPYLSNKLINRKPPVWVYLKIPINRISGTLIRGKVRI